jgi:signal transduction histidine kinase
MFRWEAALRDAGIAPTWRIDAPDEALRMPGHRALELLRVLQEALTNVLKHAAATQVRVVLAAEGDGLLVAVEDDGRGLPAGAGQGGSARGLAGMRRRAQRLGARLQIDSVPGRTRIALRVPRATG